MRIVWQITSELKVLNRFEELKKTSLYSADDNAFLWHLLELESIHQDENRGLVNVNDVLLPGHEPLTRHDDLNVNLQNSTDGLAHFKSDLPGADMIKFEDETNQYDIKSARGSEADVNSKDDLTVLSVNSFELTDCAQGSETSNIEEMLCKDHYGQNDALGIGEDPFTQDDLSNEENLCGCFLADQCMSGFVLQDGGSNDILELCNLCNGIIFTDTSHVCTGVPSDTCGKCGLVIKPPSIQSSKRTRKPNSSSTASLAWLTGRNRTSLCTHDNSSKCTNCGQRPSDNNGAGMIADDLDVVSSFSAGGISIDSATGYDYGVPMEKRSIQEFDIVQQTAKFRLVEKRANRRQRIGLTAVETQSTLNTQTVVPALGVIRSGSVLYGCSICSLIFTDKREYNDHLLIGEHDKAAVKAGLESSSCRQCKDSFHIDYHSFIAHVQDHHTILLNKCYLCKAIFMTKEDYDYHRDFCCDPNYRMSSFTCKLMLDGNNFYECTCLKVTSRHFNMHFVNHLIGCPDDCQLDSRPNLGTWDFVYGCPFCPFVSDDQSDIIKHFNESVRDHFEIQLNKKQTFDDFVQEFQMTSNKLVRCRGCFRCFFSLVDLKEHSDYCHVYPYTTYFCSPLRNKYHCFLCLTTTFSDVQSIITNRHEEEKPCIVNDSALIKKLQLNANSICLSCCFCKFLTTDAATMEQHYCDKHRLDELSECKDCQGFTYWSPMLCSHLVLKHTPLMSQCKTCKCVHPFHIVHDCQSNMADKYHCVKVDDSWMYICTCGGFRTSIFSKYLIDHVKLCSFVISSITGGGGAKASGMASKSPPIFSYSPAQFLSVFGCPMCPFSNNSLTFLRHHVQTLHPKVQCQKQSCSCQKLNKKLGSEEYVRTFVTTHRLVLLKCPQCRCDFFRNDINGHQAFCNSAAYQKYRCTSQSVKNGYLCIECLSAFSNGRDTIQHFFINGKCGFLTTPTLPKIASPDKVELSSGKEDGILKLVHNESVVKVEGSLPASEFANDDFEDVSLFGEWQFEPSMPEVCKPRSPLFLKATEGHNSHKRKHRKRGQRSMKFYNKNLRVASLPACSETNRVQPLKCASDLVEPAILEIAHGCPFCPEVSWRADWIWEHMRKSHLNQLFPGGKCCFCGRFTTLEEHIIWHIPKVWFCVNCNWYAAVLKKPEHDCANESRPTVGSFFAYQDKTLEHTYRCSSCDFKTHKFDSQSGEQPCIVAHLKVHL